MDLTNSIYQNNTNRNKEKMKNKNIHSNETDKTSKIPKIPKIIKTPNNTKGIDPAEFSKTERELEHSLEELEIYIKIFDDLVSNNDRMTERISILLSICKKSTDVGWFYPNYERYINYIIGSNIIYTFGKFIRANPKWKDCANIIVKCYNSFCEQIKLFNKQTKVLLDTDILYICNNIIMYLKHMADVTLSAKNEYLYFTNLFHKYILDSIESAKTGIDYISSLEGAKITCGARIILLQKELDNSTCNKEKESLKTSYKKSIELIDKCDKYINQSKKYVVKAIDYAKHLKCSMMTTYKQTIRYTNMVNEISKQTTAYGIIFNKMQEELSLLEPMLNNIVVSGDS